MKNKIKYILLPVIAVMSLIFLAAYGTKIKFGESWFKDSLPNGIVPNKSIRMQPGDSIYYNGVVVTSGGGSVDTSLLLHKAGTETISGNKFFSNGVYHTDSLNVTGALAKFDSIKVLKNILLGTSSKIFTVSNVMYHMETSYEWQTTFGTGLLTLDSAVGLTLNHGVYNGDGSGLTNISLSALPIDTTKITYTNRSDTITGIYNFNVIPTIASFFQNIARTIQYWLPNSASDTLLTRSQTQTITNKTINGNANTITLTRSFLRINATSTLSPTAGTYYWGAAVNDAIGTTIGLHRVYFPTACKITAANIAIYTGSGSPSSETSTFFIRLNDTNPNVTVSSAVTYTGAAYTSFTGTGLSINVGAGEFVTMGLTVPTMSTYPTNIRVSANLYITEQ